MASTSPLVASLCLALGIARAQPAESTTVDPTAAPPIDAESTPPVDPDATGRAPVLLWIDGAAPPAQWSARVRRIEDELAALAIDAVLFVPPAGQGSLARVDEELQRHGAEIALWIDATTDRAELWRREGTRMVHVAIVAGDGDADEDTFAVRCAEVVLALGTIVPPQPPPEPATPPPREPVAVPPEPAPRWDARVGTTVGGAAQDIGVIVSPLLGVGVRLGRARRLGLDAELAATALQARVEGPAGTARVGWWLARAHVGVWPVPRARVAPMIGLGGGVLAAWTRGRGNPGYRGRADTTATAMASFALDVAVRVARRLRIRGGMRLGVALPPLQVDDGGAGRRTLLPLGEVALALELVPRRSR
ncbi:MAG: hypothetical protein K1X88_11420 [Nannocystaceae bacterium]|nr:hypothetical protein [Nannocystaceae bacterium]